VAGTSPCSNLELIHWHSATKTALLTGVSATWNRPSFCVAAKHSWRMEFHSNYGVRLTLQLAPEHANPFCRAMSTCRQLELFFLKLHGLKPPNLIQVEQRIVRLLFFD